MDVGKHMWKYLGIFSGKNWRIYLDIFGYLEYGNLKWGLGYRRVRSSMRKCGESTCRSHYLTSAKITCFHLYHPYFMQVATPPSVHSQIVVVSSNLTYAAAPTLLPLGSWVGWVVMKIREVRAKEPLNNSRHFDGDDVKWARLEMRERANTAAHKSRSGQA